MEIVLTLVLIIGVLSISKGLDEKPNASPRNAANNALHSSDMHPRAPVGDVRICREQDRRIVERDLSPAAGKQEVQDAP